ncbi:MAG: ABC transporter permease [Chloroflexi bacterium]|nr:ABC transporter permease [Chloroflexota bacterium]
MLLTRLLEIAIQGLLRRSLRSIFALVAVVIGTTGLLLFFGVAGGLQKDLTAQLATYEPATILHVDVPLEVQSSPGGSPPPGISTAVLKKLQQLPHVREAFAEEQVGGTVTVASIPLPLELRPVPPGYLNSGGGIHLVSGKLFTSSSGNDIVVTVGFLQALHDGPPPGSTITAAPKGPLPSITSIVGQTFTFVPQGNANGSGTAQQLHVVGVIDDRAPYAYLPYDTGQRMLAQSGPDASPIDSAIVEVADVRAVPAVRAAIQTLNLHVETPASYANSLINVLNTARVIAATIGIAGLLLALLNIITMLLSSVSERANEIGIMKALGAHDWHIGVIFFVESILLGLVGGCVGAVVAVGLSRILSSVLPLQLPDTPPLSIMVPWGSLVGGLLLVVVLSGLSGFIPALRAARLDPAQAIASRH